MTRALRELAWVEAKLFLRDPVTVVFVLVLPLVMLYVLNGVFGSQPADPTVWEGYPAVDFYTPSYVCLVAATVGVVSMPAHLAGYREQGVLRRFQATALPMPTLLAAHAAVATVTATVGAVLMTLASVATYDAVLPESWPGVVAAYALVSAAFAALGALLGFWLPTARAAQGLGILLFFVFMLLGGAGPPREALPGTLAFVGDLLPLTYAAQAVRAPWLTGGWDHSAAAMMLGLLAGALALTAWRVRAEQVR